jgi:hypothetical protein
MVRHVTVNLGGIGVTQYTNSENELMPVALEKTSIPVKIERRIIHNRI